MFAEPDARSRNGPGRRRGDALDESADLRISREPLVERADNDNEKGDRQEHTHPGSARACDPRDEITHEGNGYPYGTSHHHRHGYGPQKLRLAHAPMFPASPSLQKA